MKPQYIFPLLLIVIDIGAAVVYASAKDWRMFVYWIAVAVINVSIAFEG